MLVRRDALFGSIKSPVVSAPVITPAALAARCDELRQHGFDFFIVATTPNLALFDLEPFGVALTPVPFLGVHSFGWQTTGLVRLFHSLDTHVFAARDLIMPDWVLLDHALLSAGLLLVTCDQDRLEDAGRSFGLTADERFVLTSLKAEATDIGFTGPIPVASYCAAPTADPHRRIGWSLCSVMPGSGLGFIAKALALGVYRARALSGTTQYDNVALRVHSKFGPARLRAARVDMHTALHSLVYQTDLRPWLAGDSMSPAPAPTWLVSATDSDRHAQMQEMIDARTHTLTILPPGVVVRGAERLIPILVSDYTDPDLPQDEHA
jgi:hypothetical protein